MRSVAALLAFLGHLMEHFRQAIDSKMEEIMLHTGSAKNFIQSNELSFLWLELTNRCNLTCVHCYSESHPNSGADDSLKLQDYERVLLEAHELGCRAVQFIGGEPSINPDLPALIRKSRALGFEHVEVFTNLYSLKDDVFESIVANSVDVATSVYGPNSSVHDAITTKLGSFNRTTQNIKKLIDSGVEVRAGVISMDGNSDFINETVSFLEGMGVNRVGVDRIRRFGRANDGSLPEVTELCGTCANGTIRVGPNGSVSPCIMSSDWVVGNLHSESLGDVLQAKPLSDIRDKIQTDVIIPRAHIAGCEPTNCSPGTGCWPCAPHACGPCTPKGFISPEEVHSP